MFSKISPTDFGVVMLLEMNFLQIGCTQPLQFTTVWLQYNYSTATAAAAAATTPLPPPLLIQCQSTKSTVTVQSPSVLLQYYTNITILHYYMKTLRLLHENQTFLQYYNIASILQYYITE